MNDKVNDNQFPACSGGTLYTIIPGDSLLGLAKRFEITVKDIMDANPGIDPRNLQIGKQICIPVPSTGPCPGGFLYIIRAGDTFYSIARRFGTVVPALIAVNPDKKPNRLIIGQTICVPAPKPIPCTGGRLYTIASGDTLYSISRRFNTTVAVLIAANQGIDIKHLRSGQVICIPTL